MTFLSWLALAAASAQSTPPEGAVPEPLAPIAADRQWQVLKPTDDRRAMLAEAGTKLGEWSIDLADQAIDGAWL
ncbi:MAG: hypothetical protein AAF211_09820, partial [Myxococcota bacterium]